MHYQIIISVLFKKRVTVGRSQAAGALRTFGVNSPDVLSAIKSASDEMLAGDPNVAKVVRIEADEVDQNDWPREVTKEKGAFANGGVYYRSGLAMWE